MDIVLLNPDGAKYLLPDQALNHSSAIRGRPCSSCQAKAQLPGQGRQPQTQYKPAGASSRYRVRPISGRAPKGHQAHPPATWSNDSHPLTPLYSCCLVRESSKRFVATDDKEGPDQQSPGNSGCGFLFTVLAGPSPDTIPDQANFYLMTNGYPGCLLEDPSGVAWSGFGHSAVADGLVGGEDPGSQPYVVDHFVNVVEALPIADFSDECSGGEQAHAGQAHQQLSLVCPGKVRDDQIFDLSLSVSNLSFSNEDGIEQLAEHETVPIAEFVLVSLEPGGGVGAVEVFGPGQIVLQEDASEADFVSSELASQTMPAAGPLPQPPQLGVGHEAAKMMVLIEASLVQEYGQPGSVAVVGLGTGAGPVADLSGVGQDHSISQGLEQVPEPVIETDRLDHSVPGTGQGREVLDDFVLGPATDPSFVDDAAVSVENDDGDLVLVQIDPDIDNIAAFSRHPRTPFVGEIRSLAVARCVSLAKDSTNTFSVRPGLFRGLHSRFGKSLQSSQASSFSHRRTSTKILHGFTLVELLIVAIILAILAAVVIPQFGESAQNTKISVVKASLHTVRSQLELYRMQHNTTYPLLATWSNQMTKKTDADGTVNVAGAYGPYLLATPVNPMDNSSAIDAVQDGSGGWAYDQSTGAFKADDGAAETDPL